ncbi:hypothetical protein DICSQDRAFT_159914 [Dichomitus squalens LYAD-421 SS1]|uniref:uncharacterized protein n=1 Tax=Dichomitus squalens (strain LYAD-421) TaxID=732165 RepID=UPI0004410989|nr:uncharacterized protein DICSQDRAFT_159914 [Dichomitus squalens LYAD-421 SS1]EJF64958.1 hypothetical protein DICSQDRAFT_159914 [Dichomitus squalens LYAD-421 SS1]
MPLLGASCRHALSALPFDLPLPLPPLSTTVCQPRSRRLQVPPHLPTSLEDEVSSMPPSRIRTIQQSLIDDYHPNIQVQDDVLESKLTKELFDDLLDTCPVPRRVGLAAIYSSSTRSRGILTRLVVATSTKAVVIQFHAKGKGANAYRGREVLAEQILCNEDVTLLAFDIGELAIALFADQNLRILNGVDLQSAFGVGRPPLAAIKFAVEEHAAVLKENVESVFAQSVWDDKRASAVTIACTQQAWVAQCVATYAGMEERVMAAKKVNTRFMNETQLRAIAQLERGDQKLALVQPTSIAHDFSAVGARHQTAHLRAERFQTRFRKDDTGVQTQRIAVHDPKTGIDFFINGTIVTAQGRNVTLKTDSSLEGRSIISITTEGADRPTNANQQRSHAVLQALQGGDILQNPFLKYIFEPSSEFAWPEAFPVVDTIPPIITKRPLNDSQQRAVEHMLLKTSETRLSIIQGPPGTGKTTVIAAFVASAVAAGTSGIWLVAQTNIAVKNIAEKLADVGFLNWRLLVSNDFHLEWHEHIYTSINKNIILSRDFKRAQRKVQGIPVILCTLSMLAHPKLHIFTTANPISTLVIDEASQIGIGDYVAPLQQFPSISKICMIGDDKQLPPFGADDDNIIQSIFEISHLRSTALFLSIQYRMPPLIGEVVSEVIYEGQLQSWPDHPVPTTQDSCWFVHTEDSRELQHETSWHNPAERLTVLKIAEKLQAEDKEYCIITPYDAQRSFLENELKASGLVWQDKCFNVDSFQGNEKDYVIVSLRGMYIVTSWDFVWDRAAQTLVGRMAAAWGDEVWVNPECLTVEDA